MSGEEQPDKDAEIRKLAAAAKDVSIVTAVHDLDGQFLHFMVREQAAYKAAAGDGATDKVWPSGSIGRRRRCKRAGPMTWPL
jgi:hypothetical protein